LEKFKKKSKKIKSKIKIQKSNSGEFRRKSSAKDFFYVGMSRKKKQLNSFYMPILSFSQLYLKNSFVPSLDLYCQPKKTNAKLQLWHSYG
jgi:hypothetical protein